MKHIFNLRVRFEIIALLFICITISPGVKCDTCYPYQYSCKSGQCISGIWTCDGDLDCDDGSDEDPAKCPACTHSHQFKCGSGECIRLMWKCDGFPECRDGSDEASCP